MVILVTGATGGIGRRVVDQLLSRGATDVRAMVANPAKARLPDGVEVVSGYVGRPESVPPALEGVDRMYLAPVNETVADVVPLIEKAGVRRIVDLSGPPGSGWEPVFQAVEAGSVDWTHLWPGEFMENHTLWAEQIKTTGRVRDGYPDAVNAPIAMDDVAAAAAVALLTDGPAQVGKSFVLTGPAAVSRAEMIAAIGAALGREIPVEKVDHDTAVKELEPAMGEYAGWYLDGIRAMLQAPQAAETAFVDLVGEPGTTFAEWAKANVADFR